MSENTVEKKSVEQESSDWSIVECEIAESLQGKIGDHTARCVCSSCACSCGDGY